jgi:hypothetical protein
MAELNMRRPNFAVAVPKLLYWQFIVTKHLLARLLIKNAETKKLIENASKQPQFDKAFGLVVTHLC